MGTRTYNYKIAKKYFMNKLLLMLSISPLLNYKIEYVLKCKFWEFCAKFNIGLPKWKKSWIQFHISKARNISNFFLYVESKQYIDSNKLVKMWHELTNESLQNTAPSVLRKSISKMNILVLKLKNLFILLELFNLEYDQKTAKSVF